MAFHDEVTLTPGTPVLLNADAVTALTVINTSGWSISLIPTEDDSAPAGTTGRLILGPGETLLSNIELAVIWPGISPAYVWALSEKAGAVQVSYA